MKPWIILACVGALLSAASAQAQPAANGHPLMDKAAAKLVEKYRNSSCDQLAQQRQAPPSASKSAAEQRVAQMLRQDAQMRKAFLDQVAAPIADKMITCGFIP